MLAYLDQVDPEAAQRARSRYACFDHFGEDSQAYGYAASFGISPSCEDEVIEQLRRAEPRAGDYAGSAGRASPRTVFYAEQNARLVRNAEEYYRTMFRGRVSSWNLRDRHMAETLEALLAAPRRTGPPAKIVVWAHNSHLGDARATEMGELGEWNVGQLARDALGRRPCWSASAPTTARSPRPPTGTARPSASACGPALPGSYEELFHAHGARASWLPLRGNAALAGAAADRGCSARSA